MGTKYSIVLLRLLVVAYLLICTEGRYSRKNFPPGFLFGTASSSYQYEGAANVDGKGASIWDTFTSTFPEKIVDHSSGAIADEFYYRYKDDIALMKHIGFDSFRFSISWPRLLPRGRISEGVSQAGLQFYNNLIDELLSNGLQPSVTLFHWDLPQVLEDKYGGFLSPNIVNDYRDYVDFCFNKFGDRVKHWITFNEPNIFASGGYDSGIKAPGRCSYYVRNCTVGNSGTEPYLVVHHMILSHGAAVKLYREKYQESQNGIIGISVQTHWIVPKLETEESTMAASRALDFAIGW
ncbi:Glycoside hydrolase [Trema orientale]|uniref:beta-glucosidase n=1 Tax=Trema orientale TaxID=63057 RepID=A0A2P5FQM9_TREOI|nr:Glycoside hydrolase [Trema orientale]